jgi:2-heptyl-3-hydroxy-4(1H)-quinolone synthase
MPARDVVIIGGGIAGLATARALRARGIDVTVVERAEHWAPVGAGIVLARNAMAVLDHVGAGAAVREGGRALPAASIHDAAGNARLQLDSEASMVAIHRADLQAALLEDLDAEVRLDTTIETLRPDGQRVHVELNDGTALDTGLLVGAEGLRSRVRELLLGSRAPRVVPAGYRVWRIVTDDVAMTDTAVEQWGRGRRVGVIPLTDGRVYAFFVAGDDVLDARTASVDAATLQRVFAGFAGPAGRLLAALDDRVEVLDHPVLELDRIDFGRGRIALIGDAAHAMTPNLGQGAAQALEDVPVLVALAETGSPDVAAALTAARRRRVGHVKRRSAVAGRVGQASGPVAVAVRDLLLGVVPTGVAARGASAITDHDPLT